MTSAKMLSFLIGLVLLFSTVRNNYCYGQTLEEQIEIDGDEAIRQGRQATALGGKPPLVTPCATAADCPAQGTGCLFRGVGAPGFCEICALKEDSFVTSYDGCGSSGGGGNVTNCTTGSECPRKNGCAVPSGSTQGFCVNCIAAPTLAVQGINVDGCRSGGGGNGTGGSDGTNCTSASDCASLPGGPYGCGKITSPNSQSTQNCIPCANGGNVPSNLSMTLDGCPQEPGGGAQGLNTISSYKVLLGFLLHFTVSYCPVLSLNGE